jgi:hypothetical protein
MNRPILNNNISVKDFKDFYWLKAELSAFCKSKGINASDRKQDLAKRILIYLQTGEITKKVRHKKNTSNFDWKNTQLTLDTIITDNYKNSENVRTFMTKEIGKHFRFNVIFLKWMQQNIGKTMQDAIVEWKRINKMKKDKNLQTEIAPQFEYNTYIRSFLSDNPDKTMKDAIAHWKLKRNQRGHTTYSRADLELIK